MRSTLRALLALSLFVGSLPVQSASVIVGGNEWRQLTETTNLTWIQVNSVCSTGFCSGGTGSLATLNGWHWASLADVQALFDAVIYPLSAQFPATNSSFSEVNSAGISAVFDTYGFTPTGSFSLHRILTGWTRTTLPANATNAYVPQIYDFYSTSATDDAGLAWVTNTNGAYSARGVYLYRAAVVPEPATLALLGLGLLGLGVTRRRKLN